MLLATTNKARQLLCMNYIGHVTAGNLAAVRDEVLTMLGDLAPGFRVLTDLSQMDRMELDCIPEISRMMQELTEKGMTTVIRVIPEPEKDIGFNILSALHYRKKVKTITCQSMQEAARHIFG